MKKSLKIMFIIIIVALALLGIIMVIKNYSSSIKKEKEFKRYEEIRKDIDNELKDYAYIISPHCIKGGPSTIITDRDLIYNRGMDKDKFLDVDGKSYCNAYIKTECIDDGKLDWDIYLSCKNYKDKGYWAE